MASEQEESSITCPPEIITEILHRLPAKSIGRFRCVSKSWLSQLTDPKIIKIHLNNKLSRQNHLILTTQDFKRSVIKGSFFLHSLPFHYSEAVATPTKFDLQLNCVFPRFVNVFGSCDGLVLVRVFCSLGKKVVVINPTTKECLQIPEIVYDKLYDSNDCVYGFGYDSVTDDYKVVSLTHHYVNAKGVCTDKVYAYVYSLRNKIWKRVADSPFCYSMAGGVFVSGCVHWIVWKNGDLGIAAFSLADESFSEVPFSEFCDDTNALIRDCQLVVLGGKLAVFINSEGVVWLMNEYGVTESWTKIVLHGIDKPKYFFEDNGKILVANKDRMMVYEAEKATFTETVCVWDPKMFYIAGYYLESLVSPKQSTEEEGNDDKDEEDFDAEVENEENEEDDDAKDKDESEDDDDADDESEEDDAKGGKNIHLERQTSERKNIDSSNTPSEGYDDSCKAKHREEKQRADRLEEELTHDLSKHQFLTHLLEENEANLVEIQAPERRTMEQGGCLDTSNDDIESLKARLAVADDERRKTIAALPETVNNTLH